VPPAITEAFSAAQRDAESTRAVVFSIDGGEYCFKSGERARSAVPCGQSDVRRWCGVCWSSGCARYADRAPAEPNIGDVDRGGRGGSPSTPPRPAALHRFASELLPPPFGSSACALVAAPGTACSRPRCRSVHPSLASFHPLTPRGLQACHLDPAQGELHGRHRAHRRHAPQQEDARFVRVPPRLEVARRLRVDDDHLRARRRRRARQDAPGVVARRTHEGPRCQQLQARLVRNLDCEWI
jgi:hypothetical protein